MQLPLLSSSPTDLQIVYQKNAGSIVAASALERRSSGSLLSRESCGVFPGQSSHKLKPLKSSPSLFALMNYNFGWDFDEEENAPDIEIEHSYKAAGESVFEPTVWNLIISI
jgi:hypothetical protein